MALAVLSSCRPTVLPRIAKPLRFTAPDTADVLSMNSLVLICEFQSPAPSIVTPLTCSAEPMRKEPVWVPSRAFLLGPALQGSGGTLAGAGDWDSQITTNEVIDDTSAASAAVH